MLLAPSLKRFCLSLRWVFSTVVVFLCCASPSYAQSEVPRERVELTSSWVRTPIPGQGMTAGYFTVSNNSSVDLVLDSVYVEAARHAMVHRTTRRGDNVSMEHVDQMVVPANSSLVLAPGGYHLMIMGLDSSFVNRKTVGITLNWQGGKQTYSVVEIKDSFEY